MMTKRTLRRGWPRAAAALPRIAARSRSGALARITLVLSTLAAAGCDSVVHPTADEPGFSVFPLRDSRAQSHGLEFNAPQGGFDRFVGGELQAGQAGLEP